MNTVLNQDTRKKNECVSHLLSMVTGCNKPKELPVFLQVKFISILKPRVLY